MGGGITSLPGVRIRVSEGSIIFSPGLFGEGILIGDARYRMTSTDAGLKYRGFALEGEYYWRVVNNFRWRGVEDLPFEELNDTAFQLQGSAMLLPKTVQLYPGGSNIFGEYGDPWDFRLGVNWYPGRTPSCARTRRRPFSSPDDDRGLSLRTQPSAASTCPDRNETS